MQERRGLPGPAFRNDKCNLSVVSASIEGNPTERHDILMKPDVVDQLFTQHYNEALLYTISLCKNRTVAEDIVSTAFFRALTMSDDSVRNFKPWLLTVCRNEYYSLCRKESRLTGEEIPEELEDNREELIESIIRKEEYRSLYRAISLLPDAQKEAVTLFYFSGLSVQSISEITGKTETNTKVLLCRARERLRKILEEEQ